ncbi:MAG: DNA polymerase III subunit gamma/tau [Treponema sp.]
MEYQVTATRRRPGRFEDLIGQDFVVATLQKSIDKGKIAHAYLFSGPRGCGKTSSARILAKSLNCEKGMNRTPCGECTSCKEIAKGSSLDVIEIDGASNTSVNDVRQIKDEVLFPPNSSRYKIYIIDEVHMLSTSAFNALLKTIEEPPPYVIFIFATTELHKVPATIKSRCQHFNFRLVSVEQLKDTLKQACDELNIKAEEEALYWIAKEATGSVRDAYTLFDQVASFSEENITMQKIQEKLGLTSLDSISSVLSFCALGNAKEALSVFNEILQNGISIEQFITDMASYLRALLLLKQGIEKESLLGFNKERLSKDVLNTWNANQIEIAFSIMLQLYKDVRFSISQRFETELAISRLSTLKNYVAPEELKLIFNAAKNMLEQDGSIEENVLSEHMQVEKKKPEIKPNFNSSINSDFSSNIEPKEEVQKKKITEEKEPNKEVVQEKKINKLGSIEELKDMIVKLCEKENSMLSLTLSSTGSWEEKEDTLYIYGNTSFDVSMLKNNMRLIGDYVNEYYIKKLKIEVLKEDYRVKNETPKVEAEPNKKVQNCKLLDIIIEMFEGELVSSTSS